MLEIPANLPFHLDQLQSDARLGEVVAEALEDLVGGRLRLEYRSSGGQAPADPPAAPARPPEAAEAVPDKDDLEEAPETSDDPLSIVQEILGAEPTDG